MSRSVAVRPMLLDTDGVASAFAVPTGTVTLVLTDVEGSASLWQDHGDVMGAVIARHYEILDAAVTKHAGVRPAEQGEGDSVVAAFTRASDAAAAVLEAQLAFAGECWPDAIELRVRMALHTGEVELRDEVNYVGSVVNQCARLRSIAHGGQVLVSDTTATLLRDRIPDSAWLVDLGSHRLRSLARVERVWQFCHHDLRREFPPLRAADVIAHNLPTPLSSFVGRQRELVRADELLGAHRLVTSSRWSSRSATCLTATSPPPLNASRACSGDRCCCRCRCHWVSWGPTPRSRWEIASLPRPPSNRWHAEPRQLAARTTTARWRSSAPSSRAMMGTPAMPKSSSTRSCRPSAPKDWCR